MEYKTLETGNRSKHNNQNKLPVEYKNIRNREQFKT